MPAGGPRWDRNSNAFRVRGGWSELRRRRHLPRFGSAIDGWRSSGIDLAERFSQIANQRWFLREVAEVARGARSFDDPDARYRAAFLPAKGVTDKGIVVILNDRGIVGIFSWEGSSNCAPATPGALIAPPP